MAVDRDHCSAAAVGDVEAAVVAGAEDAVAGDELGAVVEVQAFATKTSLAVEERAGDGVQLGDVGAPVGDHRAAPKIGAGGLPPVGYELRLRLDAVGSDGQPPVLSRMGEVVAASPLTQQDKRTPLEFI